MMYSKLAFDNIRKNSKTYFPYILTCIFTISMFYIMKSLSLNEGLKSTFGGDTTKEILKLGCYVIGIFALIFLFYTNSFLTKKRRKEFGLLNILGMEKKHISRLIGIETVYVMIISLCGGIGVGILFDKLMFGFIARLIKIDIPFGFNVSYEALAYTLVLFSIIFFLIFLNSLRMIHLSNPIELLKGGNIGEKEPKAKWIIALLGAVCLGSGYYISISIKNPMMALTLFFVAVILVIIGTYFLFTAGSIALLKILKKNKKYYYKIKHFTSISGMMYRMKQNAVGLANICILSTMVLVMVSSTASLMIGIEGIIKDRYPYQLEFNAYTGGDKEKLSDIENMVDLTAEEENIEITRKSVYSSLQFSAIYQGENEFTFSDTNDFRLIDYVYNLNFITAEDYSRYFNTNIVLDDNEVLFYSPDEKFPHDNFRIFGEEYKIAEHTNKYINAQFMPSDVVKTFGIVVKDVSVMNKLSEGQKKVYGGSSSIIISHCCVDIDGNTDKQVEFYDKVWTKLEHYVKDNNISYSTSCRETQKSNAYELYGGLFFLGIFLGILFTMATVLIIYYKQVSEGFDDKKRFEIMQKVGMSEQEVKGSIHSQVLTVFFMPLILAGIHTAFAFPIMKRMLAILQLTNVRLFAICTLCVFLIFALIYGAIYLATAKTYYKIIKK